MQRHDWSSTSPKEPMLHLSLSPCTGYQTLMLAYRTTTGSAPAYFHSLLRIDIPSRSLRSASERRLVVPFSHNIPSWWNDLPTPIRNAGSLSTFKQQLKTHLFWHLFDFILNKKKNLSLFIPSLASLYLFKQCMIIGITSTSSVCLTL